MAKKSNKTEQVLKLITKDGGNPEEAMENEEAKVTPELDPKVEFEVTNKEEKELKYEAKLKIEIEPEIEIIQNEKEETKIHLSAEKNDTGSRSALIEMNKNLINIAELIAYENIEMVMRRLNVCDCPTCYNDVLALALNTLPTKYVTTDAGKQYTQLDLYKKQYETDVLSALTKACVRVKASPRHL